ncbi:Major Facilitator Superfamily protein [Paenibacillus sp. 453mf]|nr:Major Facilitator Superfamily protein [Paenibacillus sp. 453mf]
MVAVCLFGAGLFVILTLFVHNYWLILVVTFIVFLSMDILRPTLSTQMSKMAMEQQGYIAGLNSAFTSMGNVLGPAMAGFLFDININFPYISASIILFLCFILALRARRDVRIRG